MTINNKKPEIESLGNIDDLLLGGESELFIEPKSKKRILLRAPVLTKSGYGVHSRQVARWLFEQIDKRDDLELHIEPLSWGRTPWLVNTEHLNGMVGRMVQHATRADHYDVSLQLQLPNEWDPFKADYNIGMTAAVETDKCNPEWVSKANQMDLIIVPSEFVKSVFTNTGEVSTKMIVVPEAFIDECADGVELKEFPLDRLETKCNFLVFGQFTGNNPENDRKNLAYTIKYLAEEFKDNPDVGVVVKTNFGRNTKLDRINTINTLAKVIIDTKKGTGPKFHLLHGDMTDEEVASLYRNPKISALVSLSRGEGYGLPLLEAAACGLPVIATNWSAHTEFLDHGKWIKVDYRLAPIHESRVENKIFMQGVKWAHPEEDDAKMKMQKFSQSPEVPQAWAKELAVTLQEQYNFEAISARYSEVLKDII